MVEGSKHTNISKFHIKLVVRCRAVFLFVSSVYYYYYYYYYYFSKKSSTATTGGGSNGSKPDSRCTRTLTDHHTHRHDPQSPLKASPVLALPLVSRGRVSEGESRRSALLFVDHE